MPTKLPNKVKWLGGGGTKGKGRRTDNAADNLVSHRGDANVPPWGNTPFKAYRLIIQHLD